MSEIFLSAYGLGSLIGAAVLFAIYGWGCGWKLFNDTKEIERISNAQDLVAAVKESNLLKPLWSSFAKTLTVVGDKTFSTVDAADFFSPQNLTRGMNMSFWQAYGGIFTGLGILGTFLGLTLGLSGVDMTSGDIEVLKAGIKHLLSGVEAAFVTSLVGISCAIVYSGLHHWLLKNFQGNVEALSERLDEIFPRRSAEDWLQSLNETAAKNHDESQGRTSILQSLNETAAKNHDESRAQTSMLHELNETAAKSHDESREQTAVLKNIGEQVAEAIYNAFDEKLAEYVKTICKAIETLGNAGSNKVDEIISERVGSQMDRFSAALEKFSDSIDAKLKNANEISKIMNEQMLSTLKALDETLKQQAKTSADERNADYQIFLSTLKNLTDTINEAGKKITAQQQAGVTGFAELLKASLDNFNKAMAQTLAETQKRADTSAEQNQAASGQFLSTLKNLTDTINEAGKKITAQQQAGVTGFAELLKASLDNFNQAMAQTLAETQKRADTSAEQNQATSGQFLSTLTGLSKTLQDVVDKFGEQQVNTLDNFESLVDKLLAELSAFTRRQQEFMDRFATANAEKISEAVNAFNDIVTRHNETTQKMFAQVQSQLSETEKFLQQVNSAGISLKQAAEPVKQSTLQLTKNLEETSAQMKNLSVANQTTRQNLFDLTARLSTFVNNFNGLADELERSTNVIKDSLENYNHEISDGLTNALTQFDKRLNDSVSHLKDLVEDLTYTLEDFKKFRR